jgi:tetratricopeptide (TPR) repeat protein
MSIIRIIILFALSIILASCEQKVEEKIDGSVIDLSRIDIQKRRELANWYNEKSNTYRQPSYLRRIYLDSAIMVLPDSVDYRQRLSYSYKKVGDHIKAMKILNKAVQMDIEQGYTGALEYRAWTLLYFYRDYEGTIKDVEAIEQMTGRAYNTCWGEPCGYQKGQALYRLGNYEEAIEAFEIVNIEEDKKGFSTDSNYMIFFYMARCYAELEEYENAIQLYNKALKTSNKQPEIYYQLGLVYKKLNEHDMAMKNFQLAKEYIDYGIEEPYIERFDEVFLYMIENELESSNNF